MSIDFEKAAAQADLCRLLAACYYEPGREFAQEKVFDAMIAAARHIDPDFAEQAQQLKMAFDAESEENLLVDYAKLFLGPVGTLAAPYESAWRDQQSGSPIDPTLALVELYDDGGFALDPDFRDLPDHIAVELEFLYSLLFALAAATKSGDQSAMAHALVLRRALLERHLACWITPFATAVDEKATCLFYRQLARLTETFISRQSASAAANS